MSGWNFRQPLCTYRLNLAGEPTEDGEMNEMIVPSRHRSEAEHATSRSWRFPTILNLYA